jgi:hypothetical protein
VLICSTYVLVVAGLIRATQADPPDQSLRVKTQSKALALANQKADDTKAEDPNRLPKTSLDVVMSETEQLVTTLEKEVNKRNDFRFRGPAINPAARLLVALSWAVIESKDPSLIKEIPRYKQIATTSYAIPSAQATSTREDWLKAKRLVAKLRSLIAAKREDIEDSNPDQPKKLASHRLEATMKRFNASMRWSRSNILDQESLAKNSVRAVNEGRVIDLLARSLRSFQPDDEDFGKHTAGLREAIKSRTTAAIKNDSKAYQAAAAMMSKKCTECHSEYRN